MPPRKIRLDVETASDTRALDKTARSVDDLGDEFKGLGTKAAKATPAVAGLGKEIDDVGGEAAASERKVARLRDELGRFVKLRDKAAGPGARPRAPATAIPPEVLGGGGGGDRSRVGALLGAQGLSTQLFTAATARPLITGLVGLVAANAPLIAGAVSAAVVAGLTSGVVAGGVVAAFQDPTVKAAGTNLAHELGSDLTVAGQMFIDPVLKSIGTIRAEWRREILPEIEGTFASATRFVAPLTDAFTGFVEGLLPGIRHIVDEAEPVIDVVERDLPALGRTLGDLFEDVGDSSESSAKALHDVLLTTETIVSQTGFWLKTLSEVYGVYSDIDFTVFGFVKKLQEEKDNTNAIWHEGADGAADLTAKVNEAAEAVDTLQDAFDKLNGKAIDARKAESDFQAAIDDARDAFDGRVKAIDLTTERGREYDKNLRDIATSAAEAAQAIYNTTAATGNFTMAQANAEQKLVDGREALIKQAMLYGLNRDRATELANQILRIPTNWTTTYTPQGVGEAIAAAQAIAKAVLGIERSVTIQIRTAGAVGIAQFKPRAGGGDVKAGAAYWVGEQGPEPFFPKVDGRVMSTSDAKMALGQTGYNQGTPVAKPAGRGIAPPTVLEIRSGGSRLDDLLVELIAGAVRRSGGQAATLGVRKS